MIKRRSMRVGLLASSALLLAACSLTRLPQEVLVAPAATAEPALALAADVDAPAAARATGGRLLFVDTGNLWLYENGTRSQLTDDAATSAPAWAPDGQRIAVVRREESFSNIYLLDQQGNLLQAITSIEEQSEPRSRESVHQVVWADMPAWSPDGTSLVYLSQRLPATKETADPPLYEYPLVMFETRVSGSDRATAAQEDPTPGTVLVRSNGPDHQQPTWAPDGALLAYVRAPRYGNEQRQIMLFDPQTKEIRVYPKIAPNSYDPTWSPDGAWLAYTSVVDGQTDLWVASGPERSGQPVRLTTGGSARAAAWSPDGSTLAFIQIDAQGANLYTMQLEQDTDGTLRAGRIDQITTTGTVDVMSRASWAP